MTSHPRRRLIVVEEQGLSGRRTRQIHFDEITDIGIGYLGKKSNFVTWYYLILNLKSGENYPLFQPGRFYEGGSERGVVKQWRDRLLGDIRTHPGEAP